jgi:hypothetical protein
MVSGPGKADFATPTKADSAVAFDREGIYVLRVTVTDRDCTDLNGGIVSSEVTIKP